MDYRKVLVKLGFVEGKDFALNAVSFDMLTQTRMIPHIIHHAEVAATYDVNGVELTPLIPAYDETVMIHHPLVPAVYAVDGITIITPEVPAYDEVEMISELFTLPAPAQSVLDSTWKQIQISESDIAVLINEYLKGKELLRNYENDSINIVDGNIHSWSFANIPQPTVDELVALVPIVNSAKTLTARKEALKAAGLKDRQMCEDALNLIAGFNRERVLTAQQITDMQTTFSAINAMLKDNRPSSAKALIQAIVPDGTLITAEMKQLILEELAGA